MKVFNQDTRGGLFNNYESVGTSNPDNSDAYLYSILADLEQFRDEEGGFQLMLCYPEITWGQDGKVCNVWRQTSNPYTDSEITGFQAIDLAFDMDSYNRPWGGLGHTAKNARRTGMDDSPLESRWYCAVGAYKYWREDGFIPGPRGSGSGNANNRMVTKVSLYVKA